jgi:hypothetical protein
VFKVVIDSRGRIDHVGQFGWVTDIVVVGRPPCLRGGREESGRREMIGGDGVSARERGRMRVRMGRSLLGCTGASERGRGRDASGPRGWAEPKGERRKRPDRRFCFSFSKM